MCARGEFSVRAPRRGTGPLPCKLARAAGRKFLFAPPAGDGRVSRGAVLIIIFEKQARDVELEISNQIYRRAPVAHVLQKVPRGTHFV